MKELVSSVKTDLIATIGHETLSIRVYFLLNTKTNETTTTCEVVVNLGIPGEKLVHTHRLYSNCYDYTKAFREDAEAQVAAMETHEHLEQ